MLVPGVESKHRQVVRQTGRWDLVEANRVQYRGWRRLTAGCQSQPGVHDKRRQRTKNQCGQPARQQRHAGRETDPHEVTGQRRQHVGDGSHPTGDGNHQCQIGTAQDEQRQFAICRMTSAGDNNNVHDRPPNHRWQRLLTGRKP